MIEIILNLNPFKLNTVFKRFPEEYLTVVYNDINQKQITSFKLKIFFMKIICLMVYYF